MISTNFSPTAAKVSVNNDLRPASPKFAGGQELLKKASVDCFQRLVKAEMENPQSLVSPEKLETEAKKQAKFLADHAKNSIARSEKPVHSWDVMSSEKKEAASQKAKGWGAYAEGNPIPEGLPHDEESEWRARNVFESVLFKLKPKDNTMSWGGFNK